jgi:hypothetical protein
LLQFPFQLNVGPQLKLRNLCAHVCRRNGGARIGSKKSKSPISLSFTETPLGDFIVCRSVVYRFLYDIIVFGNRHNPCSPRFGKRIRVERPLMTRRSEENQTD